MAGSQDQLTVKVVVDAKGAEIGFQSLDGRVQKTNGQFIKMDETMQVVSKRIDEVSDDIRTAFLKVGKSAEGAADTTGKAFQKATSEFDRTSGGASRLKEGFSRVQDAARSMALPLLAVNEAMAIMRQAFDAVRVAIDSTVGAAVRLESQTARINTLLTDAEIKAYDFADAILAQREAFGTDTETTAKAYYEAIASGAVDAAGAIKLMDTAQKLAIGGVTTLDTAVNALTTVMNAYGIEAKNAERISNILFIAAAGGKTDIEQLSKQMGDILTIAKSAGVSFEEVASAVSAVTAAGQPTALAMTAVRASIQELVAPSKELAMVLNDLGIESVETTIRQGGFVEILRRIAKEYGGNATALKALFTRLESLPAINALVSEKVGGQFDDMRAKSESAMKGIGDQSGRAFGIVAQTSEQRMKVASAAVDVQLTRIGKRFTQATVGIVEAFSKALQSAIDFADRLITVVGPAVSDIVSAFGKIASVLGSVIGLFGKAANAVIDFGIHVQKLDQLKPKSIMNGADAVTLYRQELEKLGGTQEAIAKKSEGPAINTAFNELAIKEAIQSLERLRDGTRRLREETASLGGTEMQRAQNERRAKLSEIGIIEEQFRKMKLTGPVFTAVFKEARKAAEQYFTKVREGIAEEGFAKLREVIGGIDEELGKVRTSTEDAFLAAEAGYALKVRELGLAAQEARERGVAVEQIREMVSLGMERANQLLGETQAAVIRKEYAEQQKKAEESLADVRVKTLDAQEKLLQSGMNEIQRLERAYELRIDELDALERQLAVSEKLDDAARNQLNLARETAFATLQAGKTEAKKNAPSGVEKALTTAQGFLDNLSKVPNIIAQVISAIARLPQLVLGIIEGATDLITRQIYEFPAKLMQALQRQLGAINETFFESFMDQIAQTIPKVITMALAEIPKKLSAMTSYFIPQIVGTLIAAVAEALPSLIAYATQVFTSELPKTILLLVSGILRAIPQIVKAFVRAIPQIVPAIVDALVEGIKEIRDAFLSIFSGGNPFAGITQAMSLGVKEGLSKVTGFREELFGVTEDLAGGAVDETKRLMESARSAGRTIWDALAAAIRQAWEWIKGIGRAIWDGFAAVARASWDWVKSIGTAVWDAFTASATAAWEFVKSIGRVMWTAFTESVTGAWEFVKSIGRVLWDGVVGSVSTIWEALKTAGLKVWEGLKALFSGDGSEAIKAFMDAGVAIWRGMKATIEGSWDFVKKIGTTIWDGLKESFTAGTAFFEGIGRTIWGGLKTAFSSATDGMAAVLNALDPSNLLKKLFKVDWGGPKGAVERFIGLDFPWASFAQGGIVPGRATVMGDSKANDTVPALVSPGEAIIPRSLMRDPAIARLIQEVLSGNKVGQHAGGLLGSAASAVTETVKSGGATVGSAVTSAVSSIAGAAVPKQIQEIFDSLKRIISNVNLASLLSDPLGYVSKILKDNLGSIVASPWRNAMEGMATKMATGGPVGGPRGAGDIVSALLSPGEFVMRRQAVDGIGTRALAQMNATGQMPGGNITIEKIDIRTEQPIDENFIRQRMIPRIKEELLKASSRGEFVLFASGVRAR
jgi:TP901 family phage tail tape measure protein